MEEAQRKELGERIRARRIDVFGTVTAAVRAAEVNPETWSRAERGDSIRADRMAAIIKALWPESGGLPDRIDATPPTSAPVGAGVDPEVLADLNELEPDQVQRVKDFIRGIKYSR